jgi:hypothetical protein
MFDPQAKLIQLPRRVKDPQTGQWVTRHDDYLEVKWRLVWFREQYPHGTIWTESILLDWDKGVSIYKASVTDGEGGMATGTGTETRQGFADFVEKSETRAIGRALAALGIGTQFVGEDLSEGDHVADAPIAVPQSIPHASTNGHPPEPSPHPTAEDLDRLFALAESCQEPKEVFGTRLRRLMGLDGQVRITKKFLRESMTVSQFDAAIAYYDNLLRQQVESDVPDTLPVTEGPQHIAITDVMGKDIPPVTEDPNESAAPESPVPVAAPVLTAEVVVQQNPRGASPEVATSEQVRVLRVLALQVDPTGKAERDLMQSFSHYPQGMPMAKYAEVQDRLHQRAKEAKGGLALADA